MSYIYSRIPTQWNSNDIYQISEGTFLKPAGRKGVSEYPIIGGTQYFDILFFITESTNTNGHIKRLKEWIIFHSFIFNIHHADYFFEVGKISRHESSISLGSIVDTENDPAAYLIDFDNIGKQIFWLYEGKLPQIKYRQCFEKYLSLSENEKSLIINYLLYLNAHRVEYGAYDLFSLHRKYWQTAKNVVLLEQVIGHAPTCSNSQELCCLVCGKDNIQNSHRTMSEKEWCKKYLMEKINHESIVNEYLKIISVAFEKIRHTTAHSALSPSARRIEQLVQLEIYDIDRTLAEFKNDTAALENLGMLVAEITRYLILEKLFGFTIFPIPKSLKLFRIGKTS